MLRTRAQGHLQLTFAKTRQDVEGAQRLRYKVFVEELGGNSDQVDHEARLERDHYDTQSKQLILIDRRRDPASLDHVVGVYRLMDGADARSIGQFYSESEYDLTPLYSSGRSLLELGRSCLHPDYRGGDALALLWQGLGSYVEDQGIELLFGVASFHGADLSVHALPLANLNHRYLAPEDLRPRARLHHSMDLMDPGQIDRAKAMRATPPLIKAYLRMGGMIGDGAFIDHAFNTVDVCLILDTAKISAKHRALYQPGLGA